MARSRFTRSQLRFMKSRCPIKKQLIEAFQFVTPEFTISQIEQVLFGLEDNLDVAKYAKKEIPAKEMQRQRLILSREKFLPYNYESLNIPNNEGTIYVFDKKNRIELSDFRNFGFVLYKTEPRVWTKPSLVTCMLRNMKIQQMKNNYSDFYVAVMLDDVDEIVLTDKVTTSLKIPFYILSAPAKVKAKELLSFVRELKPSEEEKNKKTA